MAIYIEYPSSACCWIIDMTYREIELTTLPTNDAIAINRELSYHRRLEFNRNWAIYVVIV
jgi:hypothetical protein